MRPLAEERQLLRQYGGTDIGSAQADLPSLAHQCPAGILDGVGARGGDIQDADSACSSRGNSHTSLAEHCWRKRDAQKLL